MDIMLLFAATNTDILDVTTPSRTLLAKLLFVRCGMTVIHEPHNLGSSPSDRPDLFAPLTDTGLRHHHSLCIRVYETSVGFQKMLAHPFYVEKVKNTNDMTPV